MTKLFVMIGLPASGKTSTAKEVAKENNATYISSDDLRTELLSDVSDQSDNEKIFNEMYHRTIDSLKNNKNIVYDACNLGFKNRIALLKQINKYECEKNCIVVYKPYEKCVEDDKNREKKVGENVINKMIKNIYFPNYFEGWDNIFIYCTEQYKAKNRDITSLFYGINGLCYIEHDNPHHTLTIGNHCITTYMNCISELYGDGTGLTTTNESNTARNIALAALFHDIGKPFTKKFVNHDGEQTEHAHFYQHHLVSGYFAVPYLCNRPYIPKSDMLDILSIIDYHMFPYFWEKDNNEKMKEKYKNLWGNKLFDSIMILHKADSEAH